MYVSIFHTMVLPTQAKNVSFIIAHSLQLESEFVVLHTVIPIKGTGTQLQRVARNVYDHTGLLLCGAHLPCIGLQRGPRLVNAGCNLYNFMCSCLKQQTQAAMSSRIRN